MTDNLPKAVWSGVFMIGNVEMKCHVLDNGQRIIDVDSMNDLFSSNADFDEKDVIEFAKWSKGQ